MSNQYPQQGPQQGPPPNGTYYQQPYQQMMPAAAVTKTRKPTNHVLHLILTILTGGIWGICVWLPLTMWHKWGPQEKTVTRYR